MVKYGQIMVENGGSCLKSMGDDVQNWFMVKNDAGTKAERACSDLVTWQRLAGLAGLTPCPNFSTNPLIEAGSSLARVPRPQCQFLCFSILAMACDLQ